MPLDVSTSSARELTTTAVLCGILTAIGVGKHMGIIVAVLAPFLAIWFVVSLVRMWRVPQRRLVLGGKMLLWLLSLASIVLVHLHFANAARQDGERVRHAIEGYQNVHKAYPASLAAVGIDAPALRKQWMLHYMLSDGTPMLFYAATFTAFDTYSYDFKEKVWQYQPD